MDSKASLNGIPTLARGNERLSSYKLMAKPDLKPVWRIKRFLEKIGFLNSVSSCFKFILGSQVGWVGTKWKPTIFSLMNELLMNGFEV
jgi:hypothetical protein